MTTKIWTLTNFCEFQALPFIEEDEGSKAKTDFFESRGVKVKKDAEGRYSIHGASKVPFKAEYIEEVYKWDSTMGAFVKMPPVKKSN